MRRRDFLSFATAAALGRRAWAADGAPVRGYRVLAGYPHDTAAFTQGLLVSGGALYESTGGYGASTVRRVDRVTGRVEAERGLPRDLFGEGLAAVDEHLVQLTWRAGRGLVYRRADLAPVGQFNYPGEGWGLAHDGRRLVMSDGTDKVRFLDPSTFAVTGALAVHDDGRPVENLNELEVIEGRLYANVWLTDRIAIIDLTNGRVEAWLDLSGLLPPMFRLDEDSVLNGIAYDAARGHLLVTGKRWPRLFHIEVVG